ncbi:hypothetical protein ACWDA3_26090 [Nonomuraea rubra]
MDISLVRERIAAAAAAVVLPTSRLTCTGYVPDAVTEPHFFVGEYTQEFDRTYRGMAVLEVTCRVLVGRADDRASQKLLDAMLASTGAASLKAAIEEARGEPGELALGGAADDLHVMRIQGYRWYEHAGVDYVGAELIIKVIG